MKYYCAHCGSEVRDSAVNYYKTPIGNQYYCHVEHYYADRDRMSTALGAIAKSASTPEAQKADNDKLPLDLLDPAALEGIAAVLAFGAKKYAPHNWRKGFKWSRLVAAMLRHTFAIMRGEYIDPESGLPHIDHVGCCWMFLSNHMKTKPELNDLWREPELIGKSDAIAKNPSSAS